MGFTHFIVRLKNIARVAPGRVGDFIRSPKFGGDHIFKGEPIPIEQFNDVVPALLEKHKRSWVKLPVVELLSISEEDQPEENADTDPAQTPTEPETPAPVEETPPADPPKEEEPQPEESEPVADQTPDPPKKKAAKKKAAPTIADDEISRE